MFHFVRAEHLLHEQQRIGNDLDVGRAFLFRYGECFEETGVFGDVVGGPPDVAVDLDDLAALGCHVDAVAGRTRITT